MKFRTLIASVPLFLESTLRIHNQVRNSMITELLKYIAISETILRESTAQIAGTILGWILGIGFICVIIAALTTKTDDKKPPKKPFEFEEYDMDKSSKRVKKTLVVPTRNQNNQHNTDTDSDEYWGLISFAYGKIKQTSIFKTWRKEQFDCQFGKCAICNKPMELKFAQVDHIKPRYKKGTNYSNNLALVHKKCNENKSAKTGYTRPDWIKNNKYSEKFDEKVYEITDKIRSEYPTKFPDELFKKPTSGKA